MRTIISVLIFVATATAWGQPISNPPNSTTPISPITPQLPPNQPVPLNRPQTFPNSNEGITAPAIGQTGGVTAPHTGANGGITAPDSNINGVQQAVPAPTSDAE